LSDTLRYLVTVDATSGAPVRVEQVGEAGDLTEVDLPGFVRSLGGSPGSPGPAQIVINIFAGESPVAVSSAPRPPAPNPMRDLGFVPAPPPVTPPPTTPARQRRRR